MKNFFSTINLATLSVLGLGTATFYGCQDKQQVIPEVATNFSNATSAENFDSVLNQALASLDSESHVKVVKVKDGYEISVVPGPSSLPTE